MPKLDFSSVFHRVFHGNRPDDRYTVLKQELREFQRLKQQYYRETREIWEQYNRNMAEISWMMDKRLYNPTHQPTLTPEEFLTALKETSDKNA